MGKLLSRPDSRHIWNLLKVGGGWTFKNWSYLYEGKVWAKNEDRLEKGCSRGFPMRCICIYSCNIDTVPNDS